MRRLRLGFDLDGVLCDFAMALCREMDRLHGISLNLSHMDIVDHSLEKSLGIPAEIVVDIIDSAFEHQEILPIPGAIEGLWTLADIGHQINLVSIRSRVGQNAAYLWLSRHKIPAHSISWCESGHKWKAARDLGLDVFVDDNPIEAESIGMLPCCVSVVFTQPWNIEMGQKTGVVRAFTWDDVVSIVGEVANP